MRIIIIIGLLLSGCVATNYPASNYISERINFDVLLNQVKVNYASADKDKQTAMTGQIEPLFNEVNQAMGRWQADIKANNDATESEKAYRDSMEKLGQALIK